MNDEHEPDTTVESTHKSEEGPGFTEYEDESSKLDGMPSTTSVPPLVRAEESRPHTNGAPKSESDAAGGRSAQDVAEKDDPIDSTSQSRGTSIAEQAGSTTTADAMDGQSDDADPRPDALAREKQVLREEVAELRKSIEGMHGKHEDELGELKEHLEETRGEKEHAETQYRTLLGKVNTIKSQLGERLKADAVRIYPTSRDTSLIQAQEELSQARTRIDELEEQCDSLREQNEARTAELYTKAEETEQRSKELSSLRNRTTLSQQNWTREIDDLVQREAYAKEEFVAARQAMQDWEVLAREERSVRENLAERAADLEEQVTSHREAHEKAASERDSQGLTVDGLQRALQEIQDGSLIVSCGCSR